MTHSPDECTDRHCKVLACKLAEWRAPGTLVSPAATPGRRNAKPPKLIGNSWERGIVTDDRGMPILRRDTLEPIGVKAWGEKYRREHNDRRQQTANPSGSTQ